MKTNRILSGLAKTILLLVFLIVSGNTAYAGSKNASHSGPESGQNISEIYKLSLEINIPDQCRKSCAISSRPCFEKLLIGHKDRKDAFRMANWNGVCKKEKTVCENFCERDNKDILN